ncbi:BZ3500_MvSof-1268-A1-R1_Chr2-2g05033 [Microbotryum saponariae]|uniref:Cystathionine beta-lyase n=1 Tax=Microbotryum saponariae TaxID=289078 RepID=A0A2X0K696_9BASI|nr:BZ3500_MvSof-1268-A1-R1_Chr2-2g05033 [Microbotryum saponariae]SDA00748.1 BZ3501_MvSof-1269-A2-R1_Chr2-2g04707 [Microbotryum saponariae]
MSSSPPSTTESGSSTPVSSVSHSNQSLTSSLLRAKPYRFATQCATVDNPDPSHRDQYGSSSVPIYQTATFKGMGGQYDYTRSGNPTRSHLEHHIAKISSARHAFAVTSGMGALDVIFRLLKPGDSIIAGNDLYGGSNRLLTYLKAHNGIHTHHLDTTRPDTLLPVLQNPDEKVAMVLLETPTNPLLQIVDIAAIAQLVRRYKPDAVIVVDNTMMSPYLQRPLEHGADVVYDSGTKYLSGHHDLMAGVICCNRDDVAKGIAFTINSIGNGLPPFDAFLLLRGVKTLALRLDKQQATSQLVAEYLDDLGFKVNYPGLKNHPGKAIHARLASGAGAVLSFETKDKALSERIVGAARLWGISVSFGCVNSLISMPCLMSHASIDPKVRKERNLPEDLIRLCVGIEDPEDLIDDLEAALLEAGAVRVVDEAGERHKLERVVGPDEEALASLSLSEGAQVEEELESLIVSAPGKVILFGEHAVVHGITAIAGSVDLRCYAHVESRHDGKVALNLPDFDFTSTWDIATLPWDQVEASAKAPRPESTPDAALLYLLADKIVQSREPKVAQSEQAFLYLYMHLSEQKRLSQTFTVRSALPIGAGLGSSAAFSVCVASALLYTHSQLPLPRLSPEGHHDGRRSIAHDAAEVVNAWAFTAEKIIHGTPSGVDNTVASWGGAIAFTKAVKGRAGSLEGLHGFKSIRFLLTDTKVSRNTKALVEGVAKRKLNEPDLVNPILSSIQAIADEARRCLLDTEMERKEQLRTLEGLIDQNHAHLVSLGVGHAALEAIKAKTGEEPWKLHTKLTGAGGGGCAVTIIPDAYLCKFERTDFSEAALDDVKASLHDAGFETYETKVGGSGFGILSHHNSNRSVVEAEGGAEKAVLPDVVRFKQAPPSELAAWAQAASGWAYV